MNILKYLIAETFNEGEEVVDIEKTADDGQKGVVDKLYQVFAALSAGSDELGSGEYFSVNRILADSSIVLDEQLFVTDALSAHLDSVH